jgi:hypothetical protein
MWQVGGSELNYELRIKNIFWGALFFVISFAEDDPDNDQTYGDEDGVAICHIVIKTGAVDGICLEE